MDTWILERDIKYIGMTKRTLIYILLTFFIVLISVATTKIGHTKTYDERAKGADSLEIREGIISKTAQKIYYRREGRVSVRTLGQV